MKQPEVTHVGSAGLLRDEMVAALDDMLDAFALRWKAEGFALPEIHKAIANARSRFVADIDSYWVDKILCDLAATAETRLRH